MDKETKKKLEDAVRQFDALRSEASEATKRKDEASDKVKNLLGDAENVDLAEFVVSYKYDADRMVEQVDTDKLKEKYPKVYEAVVTRKTSKGSRRLLVLARKEE